MLGDISKAEHIYIAVGYTDMRKQIDGLSALVIAQFKLDPFFKFSISVLWKKYESDESTVLGWLWLCILIRDWKTADSNGLEMNPKQKKITRQQFRWLLMAVVQPVRIKKTGPKAVI